jgi:hypothetical protein
MERKKDSQLEDKLEVKFWRAFEIKLRNCVSPLSLGHEEPPKGLGEGD